MAKRRAAASKFSLQVELGNEAMQTGADVARLLRELAGQIDHDTLAASDGGKLRDVNGNTVARWEVE